MYVCIYTILQPQFFLTAVLLPFYLMKEVIIFGGAWHEKIENLCCRAATTHCVQLYCSRSRFKSLVVDQCEDSEHSSAWLTTECNSPLKKHSLCLSSMWYGNKFFTSFIHQVFCIFCCCCVSLLIWTFFLFP